MSSVKPLSGDTHVKHGFSLFGQGHIVYLDCKVEDICEKYGSVHWVNRTVPDMEQGGCVIKTQVAARKDSEN